MATIGASSGQRTVSRMHYLMRVCETQSSGRRTAGTTCSGLRLSTSPAARFQAEQRRQSSRTKNWAIIPSRTLIRIGSPSPPSLFMDRSAGEWPSMEGRPRQRAAGTGDFSRAIMRCSSGERRIWSPIPKAGAHSCGTRTPSHSSSRSSTGTTTDRKRSREPRGSAGWNTMTVTGFVATTVAARSGSFRRQPFTSTVTSSTATAIVP